VSSIKYKCLQCGICCKTKYLCLYPHELDKAFELAYKHNISLNLEPIRYKIDFKNKIIIDLIYRVTVRPCPFFKNNKCIIHENRFIACRKYPFSNWLKTPDLFVKLLKFPKYFHEIDENCTFIKKFYGNNSKNISIKIFDAEYNALLNDIKTYESIEKRLKFLSMTNKIELKKEIKFKNENPELYKFILENWEHIPFENYSSFDFY